MKTVTAPDYAAWAGSLPHADYKTFVAVARQTGLSPEPSGANQDSGKNGLVGGLGCMAIGGLGVWGGLYLASQHGNHLFGLICAVLLGLFGLWGVGIALWYLPRFVRRWPNFYRASRFAKDNGLEFYTIGPVPEYDADVFHIPVDKGESKYILTKRTSPAVEAGKLSYRYKYNDSTQRRGYRYQFQNWGYIVVELPVSVSSRVLLRSNAPTSEKAVPLDFAQQAGAATALDEIYTLYSPAESAEVARQVFTPELLTHIRQLENRFSPVNAELIGNHLYIFSLKKTFDMYKAADVRLVFDTIAAALPSAPHGAE